MNPDLQPQSPTPSPVPPIAPSDNSNDSKKRTRIIVSIIAVLVVAIGAIVAVMLLSGNKNTPGGNKEGFIVGARPYLYACSTLERDSIAETLGFSAEKKDSVQEISALDLNKTGGDLLALTGEDFTDSTCTYDFNNSATNDGGLAADRVELYVTQFKDNKSTIDGVAANKPEYAKELTPIKSDDIAYYAIANEDQDPNKTVADASVIRGNYEMFIRLRLLKPLDEAVYKQKLTALMKQALDRIENGDAQKSTDRNGVVKIGDQSFVDLCKKVDYKKLSTAMGDVEFKATKIDSTSNYSGVKLSYEPVGHFDSRCLMSFRTTADKAAQEGVTIKGDEGAGASGQEAKSAFDLRFIQSLRMSIEQYASNEDSIKSMTALKTTLSTPTVGGFERPPLKTIALGDEAFTAQQSNDKTGQGSFDYYVREGKNIFKITVSYKKQSQPFKSDGYMVSDEIAGRVFEAMASVSR